MSSYSAAVLIRGRAEQTVLPDLGGGVFCVVIVGPEIQRPEPIKQVAFFFPKYPNIGGGGI